MVQDTALRTLSPLDSIEPAGIFAQKQPFIFLGKCIEIVYVKKKKKKGAQ
jgi:hypothetical protein